MVTRGIPQTTQQIGAFRSTVTGTILPVLGLSAALSLMNGGFNDATAAGRQASSATYGLQTSLYGLQDAITRALLPIIEDVTPAVADAVDWFVQLNEETDGFAVKAGLAGGAAFALRNQILGLLRVAGGGSVLAGATTVAGAAAAGAIGTAAYGAATGDTRAARAVDTVAQPVTDQAISAILGVLSPGLQQRFNESEGPGPFETQAEVWREQLSALGRIADRLEGLTPDRLAQSIVVNAPGVVDTEGLTRTMRELFEQGAIGPQ